MGWSKQLIMICREFEVFFYFLLVGGGYLSLLLFGDAIFVFG